jgi:hypothetical protein
MRYGQHRSRQRTDRKIRLLLRGMDRPFCLRRFGIGQTGGQLIFPSDKTARIATPKTHGREITSKVL